MLETRDGQAVKEWLPATATVIGCKPKLTSGSASGDGAPLEYSVTFSYEVNGKTFKGAYTATYPQESGHTFEIVYNPADPESNSGGDVNPPTWSRWAAILIAICLTLLAIWAWGDQDWFQN